MGCFLDAGGKDPAKLAKEWTRMLIVAGEGYWGQYADFGQPLSDNRRGTALSIALLGESRASDIVVNILLPSLIAHANRTHNPMLGETALAVYAQYPNLSENTITRAMADEALGPRKHKAITGARRQQGLLHLYRRYCEARRCFECPISGLR